MEASRPRQPDEPTEEAALAALSVLALSELPLSEFTAMAQELLQPLGLGAQAVADAVALVFPALLLGASLPAFMEQATTDEAGAAERLTLRGTPPRQSAYIVSAARRIERGGTAQDERRYLAQHLAAERTRRDAAKQIDQQAARHGPLLGWISVLDERTTDECRWANGQNFEFDRPPAVGGYPGTLHGGTCRCRAGAPFPNAPLLPDTASEALRVTRVEPLPQTVPGVRPVEPVAA